MNRVTNILGTLLILAAIYSVFELDKVSWWDASAGISMGIGLIYTKNSALSDKIFDLIKDRKKDEKKT